MWRQQKVQKHYDNSKKYQKLERKNLETIKIRSINNFIKKCLIEDYVKEGSCVFDAGSGKGGDLGKLKERNMKGYVAVDISKSCCVEAASRFRKFFKVPEIDLSINDEKINSSIKETVEKNFIELIYSTETPFPASFYCGDAFNFNLPLEKKFDVAMYQFCFHYAFNTEDSVRTAIDSIDNCLKPSSHVIFTVPNSQKILKKRTKLGDSFGNKFYKIEFEKNNDYTQKYGLEYKFTLKDAIENCSEYVVDRNELLRIMKEKGYEIILENPFKDYFLKNTNERKDLFDKMCGRGIVSPEELQVVNLYKIYVFKKI